MTRHTAERKGEEDGLLCAVWGTIGERLQVLRGLWDEGGRACCRFLVESTRYFIHSILSQVNTRGHFFLIFLQANASELTGVTAAVRSYSENASDAEKEKKYGQQVFQKADLPELPFSTPPKS
jgi:hypothetical protein